MTYQLFFQMSRPTYAQYCRQHFGQRMQKLTINAGFSCPNRDGSLGTTGCTFCNNAAFNPAYCQPAKSITRQIDEGIVFHRQRRRPSGGYLAYFQAYSNTYAPLEILRRRYEEALQHPMIQGIVIGTRPDCVDEDVLDYLATLAQRHYVMVEYGIESCYDNTLRLINRGHDFSCTKQAIIATASRSIPCGGHIILGLPGESNEEILNQADILSSLPLNTLKLHQLQILRNTTLAQQYAQDPSLVPPPFSLEEYVSLVVSFLHRLRNDIVIERYASQVPPEHQADPSRSWRHHDGTPVRYHELVSMIESQLCQ